MKRTIAVLVSLVILLAGFQSIACAEGANPHAAQWVDEAMAASLDSITRIDKAGLLYEMHCDYAYDGNPVINMLLNKFGQYDAGCSAFTTWNETGECFLTARNYDYRHKDPDGAYTGLNVAVHCAPEGKYKSLGIADACWLSLAGGAYYAGVLDDGTTDTSLAVLLPYLCVDGINEKGVSISILKLDVKDGETAVDQQESGKIAISISVLARYILDNCATVEEAVAMAQKYNIRNTAGMDFHLFVTDATGASAVLEWRYNQLTVTDTNAVTNFYVGYDDAEDRYKDGVCTEKAAKLDNTVREYHYGYGHGYHRFTGMVSALERYIDFTQEGYMTKMTPAQAMRILSVAAQDPGTEATSMTQYSVIYDAQHGSATVWLGQDYETSYNLSIQ
ncbi:MAG: linear amide C-N hydrolase [Clostridiales bacterium]|nr:linear amide C-N hydrolase [Clostridiales bacterium]